MTPLSPARSTPAIIIGSGVRGNSERPARQRWSRCTFRRSAQAWPHPACRHHAPSPPRRPCSHIPAGRPWPRPRLPHRVGLPHRPQVPQPVRATPGMQRLRTARRSNCATRSPGTLTCGCSAVICASAVATCERSWAIRLEDTSFRHYFARRGLRPASHCRIAGATRLVATAAIPAVREIAKVSYNATAFRSASCP